MPATKNRFNKCGHKGYGKFCHRCQQADQLDAKASAMLFAAQGKDQALLNAAEEMSRASTKLRKAE